MKARNPLFIRPKLFEGESLTSYLMRIANAYASTNKEIWEWYISGNKKNIHRSVDFYCSDNIDIEKLTNQMLLSEVKIKEATFFTLLESYFDEEDVTVWGFLGDTVESKKRRFCPKCLTEKKYYKLLWQVNEIQICIDHNIYLESTCKNCEKNLPYNAELLASQKCPTCFKSLGGDPKYCNELSVIEEQKKITSDWEYMLSNLHVLPEKRMGLNKGRYLAVKLLYVSQQCESVLDRGKIKLNRDYVSRLLGYIKADNSTDKYYVVTMPIIINTLRMQNLNAEFFNRIIVPESYLNSIIEEHNRFNSGPCLAPWCLSYRTSKEMKPLSYTINSVQKNYEHYKYPYICTECSLKYGFNESGEWIEIEEMIKKAYYIGVPLLNAGFLLSGFAKTLKISRYKASLYIAYLVRHKLINDEAMQRYKPTKEEISDPVQFFEIMSKIKGSQIYYASKNFNWSYREYYYYYFDPKIQLFLNQQYLTDSSGVRTKVRKKKRTPRPVINLISDDEKKEMWDKSKTYISQLVQNHSTLSDERFFEEIGRGMKWIKKYIPELLSWYNKKKEELLKANIEHIENTRINKAIGALCKFARDGVAYSQEKLVIEIGVQKKYFRLHGLFAIINSINYKILSSQLSVTELEMKLKENLTVHEWLAVADLDDT